MFVKMAFKMTPVYLSASRHGHCLPVCSLPVLCAYVFVFLFVQEFLTVSALQYDRDGLLSIRTAVDYYAHKPGGDRGYHQRLPRGLDCVRILPCCSTQTRKCLRKRGRRAGERLKMRRLCLDQNHTHVVFLCPGPLADLPAYPERQRVFTPRRRGIGHLQRQSWTPEHVFAARKMALANVRSVTNKAFILNDFFDFERSGLSIPSGDMATSG